MEANTDTNSLMAQVMAEFDFNEADLRANRNGTITETQREKFRGRGRKSQVVLGALFIALTVLITIAELQNSPPRYWIGPAIAGGFLLLPATWWWYLNRYPLGHNRVNTIIGPVTVDRKLHRGGYTLNPGARQLFIGTGAAAKALPGGAGTLERQLRILTPGVNAKLYYNNVVGGLVVHSIEFAGLDEESNVKRRSIMLWALAAALPVAFVAVVVLNNLQ